MARLIRTEKEVEGRYEDVWIVVEEDALDQWPAGPLEVVGQRVPRADTNTRPPPQARPSGESKPVATVARGLTRTTEPPSCVA